MHKNIWTKKKEDIWPGLNMTYDKRKERRGLLNCVLEEKIVRGSEKRRKKNASCHNPEFHDLQYSE